MFEASGCVPPAIPMKARKPSDKTKTKNKEAQLRFNRSEIIFLLSSDITSRVNHPTLEDDTAFGHHWTNLAPQDFWMHHAVPRVVEEECSTLGYKTYFFFSSVMGFGVKQHHCLPQSKIALPGLESKVGKKTTEAKHRV